MVVAAEPKVEIKAPFSVAAGAKLLGISARHLYKLADDGKIRTFRLGRRRLIPAAELKRIAEGSAE